MHATAVWNGGFKTTLDDGRGHTIVVDLPKDEDGQDAGCTALELSVQSLAGCISTIFALIARKRKIEFSSMRVDLEADRPEGAPTITNVHGTFHITTSASEEEVETALRLTLKTCPAGVIYHGAGIPIDIKAVVSAPQ